MRRLVCLLLIFGCDPYRNGERLLVHSDPKAAAAAIHPRDARGHKLRAQALLAAREVAEARVEARFALALRPRDAEAWALLARIEREAGRPGLALVAMERAAEFSYERHDFDALRTELRGARDRQLAQLRSASGAGSVAAGGEGEPPVAGAVRAWVKQGAHQRAIEAVLDWVGAQPALHARGPIGVDLLESVGERDAALELAMRIVEEDPVDVGARLAVARILFRLGRNGRAEQELDEAIWSASDRPAAMRQAADVLERVGRRRAACSMLSRALAFGVRVDGLRALGECLQRDGQIDQAQAILDRACAMDPACHAAKE